MMKRVFLVYCTVSLCILGTASASDTTKTPSPAQVMTIPVEAVEVESVIENQAIAANTIRLNPRAKTFVEDYTTRNRKDVMGINNMFYEIGDWELLKVDGARFRFSFNAGGLQHPEQIVDFEAS